MGDEIHVFKHIRLNLLKYHLEAGEMVQKLMVLAKSDSLSLIPTSTR